LSALLFIVCVDIWVAALSCALSSTVCVLVHHLR
jgi:hypothetical protein